MTNKLRPEPLPFLEAVSLYVPGKAPSVVDGKIFKLASNENPLGASEAAKQAVQDVTSELEVYPDGSIQELREVIGKKHDIDPERIFCGTGSDEILQLLGRAFLGKGDEVIKTTHGFLIYELVAQQCGANIVLAPEKELRTDVDAVLDCVTDKTKIVFIANPNNPTGTYLSDDEVRRLHAGLPKNVLLVLDSAYAEYVKLDDYEPGIKLVSEFENVVMTRTFSKVYGLAALRLGWSYGPKHIIEALRRVRAPFNVTATAQRAGIAAMGDQAFVDASVELNDIQRARLTDGLEKLGLAPVPSVANFVLARFPEVQGKGAGEAADYLDQRGISVRPMGGYRLPNCLRISVGDAEGVDAVISALAEFLRS